MNLKPSERRKLRFLLDVFATKILADKLCAFCGHRTGNKATVHTTTDDYVCTDCKDEYEAILNGEATE